MLKQQRRTYEPFLSQEDREALAGVRSESKLVRREERDAKQAPGDTGTDGELSIALAELPNELLDVVRVIASGTMEMLSLKPRTRKDFEAAVQHKLQGHIL